MLRIQAVHCCSPDVSIFDTGMLPVTRLRLNWTRRSGRAIIGDVPHTIKKTGVLDEVYTMRAYDLEVARATRPNPLVRRYAIHAGEYQLTLRPAGAMRNTFHLYEAESHIGTIRPKGWTYQKAIADLPETLPMPVRIFVCYLVALMLKQAAGAG